MAWTVVDGDTFEMNVDGETVTVRLADVGAPEKGQPSARLATLKLTELLGEGNVKYKKHSVDKYGRWVCDIWNADGVHVNAKMNEYLGGYRGR